MAALERKSENTATSDDSPRDAWYEGYDQGAADYAEPLVSGLAEAEQHTLERALLEAHRLVLQSQRPTTPSLSGWTAQRLSLLETDLSDAYDAVRRGG